MRCLACKALFRVKTSWDNLFIKKNYYLCDNCIIKYPAKYTYVAIPFDSLIHIFSVFDTSYDVNPISFILEREYLFKFISTKYNLKKVVFLYFDSFKEMMENKECINTLALLKREIVVMLTYFSKY